MRTLANPLTGGEAWYHGTTLDFERFSETGLRRRWTDWNAFLGTHFAASRQLAESFATPNAGDFLTAGRHLGDSPRVLSCRLRGPALEFADEGQLNLAAAAWLWGRGLLDEARLSQDRVLGPNWGPRLARHLRGEGDAVDAEEAMGFAYDALNSLGRAKAQLVRAWRRSLLDEGWRAVIYGNSIDAHRLDGVEDLTAIALRSEDIEVLAVEEVVGRLEAPAI